jgi:hypothetical protein
LWKQDLAATKPGFESVEVLDLGQAFFGGRESLIRSTKISAFAGEQMKTFFCFLDYDSPFYCL